MSYIETMGFEVPVPAVVLPTNEQATSWANNLIAASPKLQANLQAVINDATSYANRLVNPSNAAYSKLYGATSTTTTKHHLTLAQTNTLQLKKLQAAVTKYLNAINALFTTPPGAMQNNFQTDVAKKNTNWGSSPMVQSVVLPVMGSRQTGLGAMPYAAAAIVGDPKSVAIIPSGSTFRGTLTDFIISPLEPQFKAGLASLLMTNYWQLSLGVTTNAVVNGNIVAFVNAFLNAVYTAPVVYQATYIGGGTGAVVPATGPALQFPVGGNMLVGTFGLSS